VTPQENTLVAPHKNCAKRSIIKGLAPQKNVSRPSATGVAPINRIHELTMPIYEYACPDCGHQDEHMQKLADAPLSTCPSCGKTNYIKKISAAGFALKGSGWYVTDFRNGNTAPKKSGDKADSKDTSTTATDASKPQSDGAIAPKADTSSAPVAAPSPAPAPTSSPAPAAG
jgi:putative FmdB family regulatory protein